VKLAAISLGKYQLFLGENISYFSEKISAISRRKYQLFLVENSRYFLVKIAGIGKMAAIYERK